MKIGVDKAQKEGKHDLKHSDMVNIGADLFFMPIPVGDYIKITPEIDSVINRRGSKLSKMDTIGLIDISVDTKKGCEELYSCLVQDHERFSYSCLLAHNNNIKLIILVENSDGVTCIDNLGNWKNEIRWRSYYFAKKKAERIGGKIPKSPVKAETLQKTMRTMEKKYGCRFVFCKPKEAGQKIVELLGGDGDG